MTGLDGVWEDRIAHWIRTLKDDFYRPLGEISLEGCRVWEQLTLEQAQDLPYRPVSPGFTWGEAYEYCWFRGRFRLPEEAKGRRIVLQLSPGGESTLFVNGQAFGTYRADWIAEPHHYLVDQTIAETGEAGKSYEICMETYAGHYFPNCETGYCATGPVLPGSFADPATEGERRTLGRCSYGIWKEEAYQLYLDVRTLKELLSVLDPDSLRAVKIAQALKQFTYEVEFEQEEEKRIADYRRARERLKPVLEAENGSTMPLFWAVGNAHIDLAWLWPTAETRRKTARTFAAQLRHLDAYPEYFFIQSQPAAYEMCREYDPALFERIREQIRAGRWIADGAMWVEPDTNMAGGEALIRQLLYGKAYYREVLGVESRVLWLPDTFGYTAALPQILLGCDVPYLITQKIFWCCNDGETFPYHYFRWEGMDGSCVTSFLPTSYTYQTDPQEIGNVWKNRTQKEDLEAFFLPFGYGDGGGGPCRDHIEYALRQKNLEGSPHVAMGSPEAFFVWMEERGGTKHKYTGELYFSSHRGTYTSQARIKRENRRSEFAMREMEIWSSLALLQGMEYDRQRAERLWKLLLFQQFHDILPGSSIERVYEEAGKAHAAVQQGAAEMTALAQEKLRTGAEGVTVWNSLSFPRQELVRLPECYSDGAVTQNGEPVAVQKTGTQTAALVSLPACGAVTLFPRRAEEGQRAGTAGEKSAGTVMLTEAGIPGASVRKEDGGWRMENTRLRVRINAKGEVTSFLLKESGRELAAAPMNRLRLFKDLPRHFDAWDIDENYREQELPGAYEQKVEVVSEGLEAAVLVTGRIGASSYEQWIRLAAEGERLEFETKVEWRELHRLLKVSFPLQVQTANARQEMQFGYVERPTHRSRTYDKDRFEVCNHKYTALCDNGHGAAVLNDCKYGVSVEENSINLTLLRAPASPQMRADNGTQSFTYALYGWEGSFAESDVIRQGYALNVKPEVSPGSAGGFSFLGIDRKNVLLEAMKPAEDGSRDLILRLYEAAGAAVEAKLRFGCKILQAKVCNMLEQETGEAAVCGEEELALTFRAFEIKTIRVKCLLI